MFESLKQTPFCGFHVPKFDSLTTIRFDTIKKDGIEQRVQVVEPVERPDFGKLKADDFSIQVVKDAGLLGTLKPCAQIHLSPLEAQECVIDAVAAMDDKDFAQRIKIESDKKPAPSPAPASAPSPAEPSK